MVGLTVGAKDSLAHRLRVSTADAAGVAKPRPLGNATVETRLRFGDTAAADLAPVALQAGIEDAVQGIVRLSLPADHALKPGVYFWEADLLQAGERITIGAGQLAVLPTLFES